MAKKYFTVVDLRNNLEVINKALEKYGFDFRLRESGRNGYQAVDEYYVHPDGTPHEDGAVRNICCGSSRECNDAARQHYYSRYNKAYRKGLIKAEERKGI